MTDADAKSIIDQSLNFEAARTNTKRDYVKEFENAGLSPLTVAKFMSSILYSNIRAIPGTRR